MSQGKVRQRAGADSILGCKSQSQAQHLPLIHLVTLPAHSQGCFLISEMRGVNEVTSKTISRSYLLGFL